MDDYVYCHRCAGRLRNARVAGAVRPQCVDCGAVVFLDPKVAVVVVAASADSKILMVKRDIEPMMGRWSFPSGYVDRGEVVEDAARREVWEEENVEVRLDALLGVYSRAGAAVVLVAYAATVVGGVARAGDETREAAYFAPSALPPLPFPHDDEILAAWRRETAGASRS